MRPEFKPIDYSELNGRQQEAYNFQKVSSVLADYGYMTIRLSDDWGGADFIAQHRDGSFLKVQLKGRLTVNRKYRDPDLHICFRAGQDWYLYSHKEVLDQILADGKLVGTKSWDDDGGYSFPRLSKRHEEILAPFRIRQLIS